MEKSPKISAKRGKRTLHVKANRVENKALIMPGTPSYDSVTITICNTASEVLRWAVKSTNRYGQLNPDKKAIITLNGGLVKKAGIQLEWLWCKEMEVHDGA